MRLGTILLGLLAAGSDAGPIRAGVPMTVECRAEAGADPAIAAALCDALRLRADAPLHLVVLAAGPAALSARLDRDGRQGLRMDLSLSDRPIAQDDIAAFAQDLLRFGVPD